MTKPLALLVYENLLLGSQLINRLQDLGYRVQTLADASQLIEQVQREKPLVVILDLNVSYTDVNRMITEVRQDPTTSHVPILAIGDHRNPKQQHEARGAGANMVASSDAGFLVQLPQLLEQVLAVE